MKNLTSDESLLSDLSASYLAFLDAQRRFFALQTDRVAIIKMALLQGKTDVAMYLIQYMSGNELFALFERLLPYAVRMHRYTHATREAILKMPKDAVLAQIEAAIEPYLANGTYDEYRRVLELCEHLDAEMTQRLARRAAAHSDPDIREAGEDYLNKNA